VAILFDSFESQTRNSSPAGAPDIAKSDLTPSLPPDCPVQVIRTWTIRNAKLVLKFELINKTDEPIEIGHLGIPLIFNNLITDRTLAEAHEKNSFSDPYIGLDAGYVQVTRLKGTGPALVVVPEGDTPFEAYQPLREPARPQQTAEGMFEWVVRSKALAEKDWGKARPWNPPTSEILPPKGRRVIGLRFLLSDSIRSIENTLKGQRASGRSRNSRLCSSERHRGKTLFEYAVKGRESFGRAGVGDDDRAFEVSFVEVAGFRDQVECMGDARD
jgi:hypothetical protein